MGILNWFDKKPDSDPEKQYEKMKKYYREVVGLSKEEAEVKARNWVNTTGRKARELDEK